MTKNIENAMEESPTLDEVNELLEQAFGRGTEGNYTRKSPLPFLDIDEECRLSKKLGRIIKKNLFNHEEIGSFVNSDGSYLLLCRRGMFFRYVIEAKRYAKLYEERFGRKVVIEHNGQFL